MTVLLCLKEFRRLLTAVNIDRDFTQSLMTNASFN